MAALLLLVGCGGGNRATVTHPATSGTLELVTAARGDYIGESHAHVARHSLSDEVSLVRLDGSAICASIVVRSLATESAPDLSAGSSDVSLEVSGRALAADAISGPPPEHVTLEGYELQRRETGRYETVCVETNTNGDCVQSERQPIFEEARIPRPRRATIRSAVACFANDGSVTPSTPSVDFLVGASRYGFDLASPAPAGTAWPVDASGAPRAIVAPGFEALASYRPSSAGGRTPMPATSGSDAPAARPAPPAPPAVDEDGSRRRLATGRFEVAPLTLLGANGRPVAILDANGELRVQGRSAGRIDGGALIREGHAVIVIEADGTLHIEQRGRLSAMGRIASDGHVTSSDGTDIVISPNGRITSAGRPLRSRFQRVPPQARRTAALMVLVSSSSLR